MRQQPQASILVRPNHENFNMEDEEENMSEGNEDKEDTEAIEEGIEAKTMSKPSDVRKRKLVGT